MRKAVTFTLASALSLSGMFLSRLPEGFIARAQADAPSVKKFRPTVITAGTRTFTMRFEGRGFASDSKVLFDGVPLPPPRVNPKGRLLLVEVDASLVSSPGTHTVIVSNSDGSTSDPLTFTVGPQDPDLSITLSGNAVQEDSGLIFLPTLLTDSFQESSEILVWSRAVNVTEVRGGVQIEIPDGFVDDPAEIPITLVDKKGNLSNTELFFVVPKPAEISFIDPDSIEVGTDDVPLNVHGDFKSGAVVFVNDMELPTTEGKNGRLEVVIPGSLRSAPAQLVVRVEQDGIQSQDSILTVTPTDAPFIFTIAPIRIRQGERKPSVEVVGANFGRNSSATIDGQETSIRDFSGKRLTIAIPADLSLGSHVVQVTDKDGNPTNSVSFEIVPDVEVSTLAGSGRFGFNTGCVSAEDANFVRPRRMTFGPDGLLYITDQQNHAIRTLDLNSGQTCTVAGTGEDGYNDSGNEMGAPPTFSFPSGVAVDSSGAIYVTENGNNVVRKIERSGNSITVSTFAGLFSEITNQDRQERFNSTRQGLANYKDASSLGSGFRSPDDIVAGPGGVFYIADAGNSAIRRISKSGDGFVVETIAGNGVPGFADGAAKNARFNTPTALALSADGNFLFVADTNNNRVRKIDLVNRRVSTVAGGGDGRLLDGPGGQATLSRPIGLALDSDGVLYVSEFTLSTIRRIDPAGNVTSVTGGGSTKLRDGPGLTARFNEPRGLAINSALGILCIADYENFVIRKIALR